MKIKFILLGLGILSLASCGTPLKSTGVDWGEKAEESHQRLVDRRDRY